MQILNLINPDQSEIKYNIIAFPDGELHVRLGEINRKDSVKIICSITNANDLFILMQISDIMNRQELEIDTLQINYLMGMRCDRLFSLNESFTLKIVADVVNSFKSERVLILEPHSNRTTKLISRCEQLINPIYEFIKQNINNNYTICYPDKGAKDRYSLKYQTPSYICCEKERELETGRFLKFNIGETKLDETPKNIIVVDDLCDGGGTFMGVGNLLKDNYSPENLILVITHAIQLEGLKRVATVYDQVYITNSYKNWKDVNDLPENITVIEVL